MKTKDSIADARARSLGEKVTRDGVLTNCSVTGLRPPKGYAQPAYSMGCGPQAGEGSLPAHLGRNQPLTRRPPAGKSAGGRHPLPSGEGLTRAPGLPARFAGTNPECL